MLYDNQSPHEWVAFHPRDISLLNNQHNNGKYDCLKKQTKMQRATHFLTVQLEDLKIIHGPVAPNKKAAGFEG